MDENRFDSMARSLTFGTSRRRTLGGALAAALVGLGLTEPDDAAAGKSGKCKPKCDECEACLKGTCKKTSSGLKKCKRGKCKPKENGTSCSGGRTCQSGTCGCSDGTTVCGQTCCRADQLCQVGACACPAGQEECGGNCVPQCNPATQARNPETCTCCLVLQSCTNPTNNPIPDPSCCSGVCAPLFQNASICTQGANGRPCNNGDHCISGKCTNGLCTA